MSESLLERIENNLVDGRLPASFTLVPRQSENEVCFAPGAQDGIGIFHMGNPKVSWKERVLIFWAVRKICAYKREAADKVFARLFSTIPPIRIIDEIQKHVFKYQKWLNLDGILGYAKRKLYSEKVDFVKLALSLLELFVEPDDDTKQAVLTLGLCDEFTIFAVFNARHWKDGNALVFDLAKKTEGWGRIFAIEQLDANTDEIRDWLLSDGRHNAIMADYSAYTVFEKVNVAKRLKENVTDSQFDSIAELIVDLFSCDAVSGIEQVQDKKTVLSDFIMQAEQHPLSWNICDALYSIECDSDKAIAELKEKCTVVLESEDCRKIVRAELEKGNAVQLAKRIGIEYLPVLYKYIEENFERGQWLCNDFFKDEQYREKIVDLFRKNTDFSKIALGPEICLGLGKGYEENNKVENLLSAIQKYPLTATDFITIGLQSKVICTRNLSLRAIESWCKIKNCTLKELSSDLYKAVLELQKVEPDKDVLERIQKLVEG